MNADVGMHHVKNTGNTRSPLSNTSTLYIKDTSTIIMHNSSLHIQTKGYAGLCYSILDSMAKKTSCCHYFSHGASLHQHSFSTMTYNIYINRSRYMYNTTCVYFRKRCINHHSLLANKLYTPVSILFKTCHCIGWRC